MSNVSFHEDYQCSKKNQNKLVINLSDIKTVIGVPIEYQPSNLAKCPVKFSYTLSLIYVASSIAHRWMKQQEICNPWSFQGVIGTLGPKKRSIEIVQIIKKCVIICNNLKQPALSFRDNIQPSPRFIPCSEGPSHSVHVVRGPKKTPPSSPKHKQMLQKAVELSALGILLLRYSHIPGMDSKGGGFS